MTHTVHMDLPIRPGTARRLGLRQPGKMEETWERSDRPGWGSTNCPAAWTETSGTSADFAAGGVIHSAPRASDEMFVLVDEGCAYVTPDMARRYGADFLAKLGGIRPENIHEMEQEKPRDD